MVQKYMGLEGITRSTIGIGENDDKKLLACRVNVKWEEMRSEIEDKVNNLLLQMGKGALSLIEKVNNFQLCLNTVRWVNYLL